jgi:hypothetical protein
MVRPQEIIDAVIATFSRSSELPDDANFVGYEPDIGSEPITLPLIEVSTGPITKVSDTNTDFIEFVTDNNGNDIGRKYETGYTLQLDVAVWTAHGSMYSPREIGNTVRDLLYIHTSSGPNKPLRAEDGSSLDEVWHFYLQEGSQTDELQRTPTLRRWRQSITVSAVEQYITEPDQPPIERVTELFDTDNDGDIDLELTVE